MYINITYKRHIKNTFTTGQLDMTPGTRMHKLVLVLIPDVCQGKYPASKQCQISHVVTLTRICWKDHMRDHQRTKKEEEWETFEGFNFRQFKQDP